MIKYRPNNISLIKTKRIYSFVLTCGKGIIFISIQMHQGKLKVLYHCQLID